MSEDLLEELAIERIVVALDTSPLGEAAFETAAGLAAGLRAELAALFIEDINLMRLAALPFARELGLASAAARQLAAPDIERALRLQAETLRRELAAAASELALQWSFQVVRGRVCEAAIECTRELDLLVLGKAGHGAAARPSWLAAPARGVRRGRAKPFALLSRRPVVALYGATSSAPRALTAAHTLAHIAKSELVLLIIAREPGDFTELRAQAQSWLAARGAAARYLWLQDRAVATVARAVTGLHGAVLLWYGENAPDDERSFALLLDELECPLVRVT